MKTFLRQSTAAEREALASKVDSTVDYFYQIAGGHKKPGAQLVKRLVAAEPRLTRHELRGDIWDAPTTRLNRRATDPKG